jgi:DNA-binding MarR family transcriptional regulator
MGSPRTAKADAEGEQGCSSAVTAPDPVDYHALAKFRFELRKFLALRDEAAERAGLTSQHHQALLAIKGFGSDGALTIGDLAAYLLLRHHSVVELADRLANLGLVQRSPDPRDGRRVLLRLTEEGQRRLRSLSGIHAREVRAIGETLGEVIKSLTSDEEGSA